jgi:hypothetical protein
MEYEFSWDGAVAVVSVRNFATKQGHTPQLPRSIPGDSARPSPSPNPNPREDIKSATPHEPKAPEKPQRPKPRTLKPAVREIWPECAKTALQVSGNRWEKLTEDRLTSMSARLAEYPSRPPEILVHAILGAWSYWRSSNKDGSMTKHCVPETIYGPKKFAKYLERYENDQRNLAAAHHSSGQVDLEQSPLAAQTLDLVRNPAWMDLPPVKPLPGRAKP